MVVKWSRSAAEPGASADLRRWSHDVTGMLKRERARRALTQKDMALNLGVSQETISAMERDPHQVRVERLFMALRMLGLEVVVRERVERVRVAQED
jgi:HTH-type transcriptional regulator/antitoxin HipB